MNVNAIIQILDDITKGREYEYSPRGENLWKLVDIKDLTIFTDENKFRLKKISGKFVERTKEGFPVQPDDIVGVVDQWENKLKLTNGKVILTDDFKARFISIKEVYWYVESRVGNQWFMIEDRVKGLEINDNTKILYALGFRI